MSSVAIIPARGGSKRLPRKNVIEFLGKPMIAHTIIAAQRSELFERVVVSTEDAEIADIAQAFGGIVHQRASNLAQDDSRVVQVISQVLNDEKEAGRCHTNVCSLYATAPLRTAEDIQSTMGLLEVGLCDRAIAITNFDLPPHQALRETGTGELVALNPQQVTQRMHGAGTLWADNGSTYVATVEAFLSRGTFFGPGLRGYKMPRIRSIDINTQEDLEMVQFAAEWLARQRSS